MADFPSGTLILKEDSKYRTETQKNPGLRNETEGGYVLTRPRYTRKPRKVFTTGFTDITENEKQVLQNFWDQKYGGSDSFTWTDRVSGVTYVVRFGDGELKFTYSGKGLTFRWDIGDIKLEQV